MATCFGPPPLPPKKTIVIIDGHSSLRKSRPQPPPIHPRRDKLVKSSTYHSFRDPDEDAIVVLGSEDVEVKSITAKISQSRRKVASLRNTNSLSRRGTAGYSLAPLSLLSRSHSDGNLSKSEGVAGMVPPLNGGTLNKCLRVLGSSWKNLLQLGGMSRTPKPAPQVKKVAPPAVPDVFRHSGSSFGSAGYSSSEDGCFLPASQENHANRDGCEHTDVYGMAGKSPGPQFTYPAFTFPGPQVQYSTLMHNQAAYYHHQMSLQEDQGIDMTQSPGRDSPGSSGSGSGSGSRHSTASLDSGRASGYHLLGPGGPRSGTLSSSPRCSLSSSSLGSSEHGGPGARVERLLHQGVPDQDIIHTWLMDLHFEEYFPLFASAGYDMPTICRMTPEDLTAIGIKKPNHRKKLKAEIAQLNIPDGLPDYIPGSLEEWLQLLRLEEYGTALHQQGYQTVEDVTQLTWEDLEDIGIVKLGHQKKMMLAIKRVKDVRAGKRFSNQTTTQEALLSSPPAAETTTSDDLFPSNVHTSFHSFHQQWEVEGSQQLLAHAALSAAQPQYYFQTMYCPDIVPIKIRGGRGKSLESLEDPTERSSHHTFSSENTQTFYYQGPGGWRPRSYDDGDITPTNECSIPLHEGGGTLPRPRGLVRPRPIAKIPAKTRADIEKPTFSYKSLPRDLIDISKYNLDQYNYTSTLPPSGNDSSPRCNLKRRPPSPPKRQSSRQDDVVIDCSGPIPKANETIVTVDLHNTSPSPLSLPAYPSSEELSEADDLPLPPPPAPATPPSSKRLPAPNWGIEEQELIASLALNQPNRTGSDASFKSSSSTESDSLPFANENAGTIKQRAARPHPSLPSMDYPTTEFVPPKHVQHTTMSSELAASQKALRERPATQEPVDVLNDIGNMLANLTDELDAMLEEEKRQGLNQ